MAVLIFVRILGAKRNLDLRFLFKDLGRYVNEFILITFYSNEAH